jgi:DNA-binding GntR family transcriptional regulator
MQGSGPLAAARASLAERIRHTVEADILAGRLAPGAAVDEKALAAAHGVSRTPVREALLWLAAHGLVEFQPRAAIRVRRPDSAELVALLEYLAELEAVCARLAAQRMTLAQRHALGAAQQAAAACAAVDDRAGYEQANEAFHTLLYAASGNPVVVGQLQRTRARLAAFRRTVMEQPGRLASASQEHDAIVSAVLQGDADAAMRAMRDHVLRKGKAVADVVLAQPAPAAPLQRTV